MKNGDVIFVMTETGLSPAFIITEDLFSEKLLEDGYLGIYHLVSLHPTGNYKLISDDEIFRAKAASVAKWRKHHKII